MSLLTFITFLLVGLISGSIAGFFIRGRGFGLLGDTIVGVIGCFVGGYIFRSLGIFPDTLLGDIIIGVIGAMILLVLIKVVKKI